MIPTAESAGLPQWSAPFTENRPLDVSTALVQLLEQLGVGAAFGITGGALAPFFDALSRAAFPVIHTRHESGAAFCACEAYFASGRPSVVFTTTGPGVTNALTGLLAARTEGAKVLLISPATAPMARGRGALQETTHHTLPVGLLQAGTVFDYVATPDHPAELDAVAARLATGFSRPGRFVAHLCLATPVQAQPGKALRPRVSVGPVGASSAAVRTVVETLGDRPFAIWAGFGARDAAPQLLALAERTRAPVICTPRAKGVFPERHPLYLGLSGFAGHASVERYFRTTRPDHLLVLGTRLGESSSYWQSELLPARSVVHVDLDPDAAARAFPNAATVAVQAEIGALLEALGDALPARLGLGEVLGPGEPCFAEPREEGPVRAEVVMAALQRIVVEGSDALLMADAGNSVAWTNHLLRFDAPGRYRASMAFGSMGHFTTGVVGAALARDGKVVTVVGDGAMLMNTEVSTAVATGARAVWLVMNDACLGMVLQGMQALGFASPRVMLPPTDFAAMARAMGAEGARVEKETELEPALRRAMAANGPYVIDVQTDPGEKAPWTKRIEALVRQGADAKEKQG